MNQYRRKPRIITAVRCTVRGDVTITTADEQTHLYADPGDYIVLTDGLPSGVYSGKTFFDEYEEVPALNIFGGIGGSVPAQQFPLGFNHLTDPTPHHLIPPMHYTTGDPPPNFVNTMCTVSSACTDPKKMNGACDQR